MSKLSLTDVLVFMKDNTFKSIKPTNDEILKMAKNDKARFLFFPVNSKYGTKYYKVKASDIMTDIKISITGSMAICLVSDDALDISYEADINLKGNNIAESMSVLGDIYNTQLCVEQMTSMANGSESAAILLEFDIKIYADDQYYHLTPELYEDTQGEKDPEDRTPLDECEETYMLFSSLLDYIEYSIFYRYGYDEDLDRYTSYIMSNDKTYTKFARDSLNKLSKLYKCAVLLDTSTPLYFTISPDEYNAIYSKSSYSFEYVIYENEVASAMNEIDDADLNVYIVQELDTDYYILWDDTIYVSYVNTFLFILSSLSDISALLKLLHSSMADEGLMAICYAIHASYNVGYHTINVEIDCTDRMIRNGYDAIYKLAQDSIYEKSKAIKDYKSLEGPINDIRTKYSNPKR